MTFEQRRAEKWGRIIEIAEGAARRFADQPETVAKLRAIADEARAQLVKPEAP